MALVSEGEDVRLKQRPYRANKWAYAEVSAEVSVKDGEKKTRPHIPEADEVTRPDGRGE